MRDPLDPRPDVHDFDACLARSAESVRLAQKLGAALFTDAEDTAEAATQALDRAIRALTEARTTVALAAVRQRLLRGFGDVAALDPAEIRSVMAQADVASLVVHVDRRAQLRVGEGGLATWTLTPGMSDEALAAAVLQMKEHLPDFLKTV